jgi:hypothetical protein
LAKEKPGSEPDSGKLTGNEKSIISSLSQTWNDYLKLDGRTKEDDNDFRGGMNACQKSIAYFAARRANSEILL